MDTRKVSPVPDHKTPGVQWVLSKYQITFDVTIITAATAKISLAELREKKWVT